METNLQTVEAAVSALKPEFDVVFEVALSDASTPNFMPPSAADLLQICVANIAENDLVFTFSVTATLQAAAQAARQLIKDHRDRFRKALESVSGDAFDVSKALIPVFLSLKAAGTINIPAAPTALAFVALVLTRMGIAALCGEQSVTPLPLSRTRRKRKGKE